MNEELNCLIGLNELLDKIENDPEISKKISSEKIGLLNESLDFLTRYILKTKATDGDNNDEN